MIRAEKRASASVRSACDKHRQKVINSADVRQSILPGQQNVHRRNPLVDDAQSPARGLVARGGVEPPTFRFSVGRSYQLSYLAVLTLAVLTGLEPATSALTGRRALQLLHRTLQLLTYPYPQRDSNPCYRLERAASWATRR